MATFNHINQFVEDLAQQVHDFTPSTGDQVRIALTAAANAPVAANSVLADLTEITYTNLATPDRNVTINALSGQSTGNYVLIFDDLVLTAVGGAAQTFRFVAHYNDTPVTPLDPLINWYDHGSDVTLAENETFTIDYNPTLGFFSLQGT